MGDGDGDLSEFLLGLATSRAALGGSWVFDFHHRWYSRSKQSPTCLHYSPFMTYRKTQQFNYTRPETTGGL